MRKSLTSSADKQASSDDMRTHRLPLLSSTLPGSCQAHVQKDSHSFVTSTWLFRPRHRPPRMQESTVLPNRSHVGAKPLGFLQTSNVHVILRQLFHKKVTLPVNTGAAGSRSRTRRTTYPDVARALHPRANVPCRSEQERLPFRSLCRNQRRYPEKLVPCVRVSL